MVDKEKIRKIVSRLSSRTGYGVIWKPTSPDARVLETVFAGITARVSQGYSGEYYLVLSNQNDVLLEEVSDSDILDQFDDDNPIKELYELARKEALGVDKTLDDFLGALSDGD